jgi:sec-independent protein translocase protein TatA
MHLGFGELLLIFLVILLIFGASKLPQLGDALGRGIKNFKKATTSEEESVDVSPKKLEGTAPTTSAAPVERSAAAQKK